MKSAAAHLASHSALALHPEVQCPVAVGTAAHPAAVLVEVRRAAPGAAEAAEAGSGRNALPAGHETATRSDPPVHRWPGTSRPVAQAPRERVVRWGSRVQPRPKPVSPMRPVVIPWPARSGSLRLHPSLVWLELPQPREPLPLRAEPACPSTRPRSGAAKRLRRSQQE